MQHSFIILDPGPEFVGWSGQVEERIVCVMTPRVLTDAEIRRTAWELVVRQGGDCATCENLGCPLRRSM